jgi:hypothetical protein
MDRFRDFGDFIMNNYAQINELGIVENIVVADSEWVALQSGEWVEYLEDNPAYIGGSYDHQNNIFISPQPFPSWSLDENYNWKPPTPQPNDDCYWNEESLSWQLIV